MVDFFCGGGGLAILVEISKYSVETFNNKKTEYNKKNAQTLISNNYFIRESNIAKSKPLPYLT